MVVRCGKRYYLSSRRCTGCFHLQDERDPNEQRESALLNNTPNLIGQATPDGWKIVSEIMAPADATGGCHSSAFRVQRGDDEAFLKAIRISVQGTTGESFVDRLYEATAQYRFERFLLDECKSRRLKRVVRVLESCELSISGWPLPIPALVFELASGDLRASLKVVESVDVSYRLRVLHQAAIGLQELHMLNISHQDLKPSNIVLIPDQGAKLADLGRAIKREEGGPFASMEFAGDPNYKPFEMLYGLGGVEWERHRLSADAFMFGSIVAFVFSGISAVSGTISHLDQQMYPRSFRGDYPDVLPHLSAAFTNFLSDLQGSVPAEVRKEVVGIVRDLCDPDPGRRGFGKGRLTDNPTRYIQQLITRLDILATKSLVRGT